MDLSLVFSALAVVAAALLFDWWYFALLRSRRLPPGPIPWPIVGNLPEVAKVGPDFAKLSQELEAKYGKIVTLWIGKRPMVIVSDPALTHDALVKQGTFFANRCKLPSQKVFSTGFLTLNASEGALTVALRKNVMTYILGPAKLKAFKELRDASYEGIISAVKSAAAAAEDGEAEVRVSPITRFRLFKYAWAVAFGVELEDGKVEEFMRLLFERMRLAFGFYLGDFIEAWGVFESRSRRLGEANHKRCLELVGPLIDRLRLMQGDKSVIGGNYCETLFQLEKSFPALNTSAITSLALEFMNASVHTTTGAIDSAMTLLSEHPEVQKRLYREIESTVGNRTVDESDLPELPYLSAVVRETLRRNPPARTSLPHATSELRKLGGYDIPTDAVILFGLEALQHDPNRWSDPLAFKPERFLEDNIDVMGTRDFNFLPFGAGRRVCPGSQLAMLALSTVIGSLVQSFEWRKPPGAQKVDSEAGTVLCARPRSM